MSDVALVSLGTTPGLRHADRELAALLDEAGASCELIHVRIRTGGHLRRSAAVNDLVEALAARRVAPDRPARATVYSTVTAAFLQRPTGPYAVRFDSPAALNRPGAAGAWQRARERRVLSRARLLLPWGEAGARALPESVVSPAGSERAPRVLPLAVPIEASAPAPRRDIDAVAYARPAAKRGLDLLCEAWRAARPPWGRLLICGIERAPALRWLGRRLVAEPPGVEWAGPLSHERWLALLARSRVFVNASRKEDYAISQLEGLAAGAVLVTVPSPGAFEALPLARRLDAELVAGGLSAEALADALGAGLRLDDAAREEYARGAQAMLAPYRREAVRRTVAEQVLPALGIHTGGGA